MDFFEDAVVSIKKASKNVGEKANEVYDVSKKKINVAELKNKINSTEAELGHIVYEAKKNNTDYEEKIEPYITLLNKLNEQIKILQKEMDQIKKIITCPNCQTTNPEKAKFCFHCGAKLNE